MTLPSRVRPDLFVNKLLRIAGGTILSGSGEDCRTDWQRNAQAINRFAMGGSAVFLLPQAVMPGGVSSRIL